MPGVPCEALVATLLVKSGRLRGVPELYLKVADASDEIVVPQRGLEGRGKGALGGVAVAHALLPRLAHVGRHERLGRNSET